MDAWKDRCIKGRVDRRRVELVNLKIDELTAGCFQGNVGVYVQ
jgi:hypothetical protein